MAVSVYKDSNFSIDYQVFPRLICAKLRKVVQRCMTLCSVAQNVLFHVVPLHCLSERCLSWRAKNRILKPEEPYLQKVSNGGHERTNI